VGEGDTTAGAVAAATCAGDGSSACASMACTDSSNPATIARDAGRSDPSGAIVDCTFADGRATPPVVGRERLLLLPDIEVERAWPPRFDKGGKGRGGGPRIT